MRPTLLLLLLLIGLAGCCSGTLNMKVNIAEKANQNSPIAVDLLVVYDEDVFQELIGLTAKEWFAKRAQILKDLSSNDPPALELRQWEWIPAQQVSPQMIPLRKLILSQSPGALIFADYQSPGDHRAFTQACASVTVDFQEEDFAVRPAK